MTLVAVHQRQGSFSDRWVTRCEELGLAVRLVDGYRSDVIGELSNCSAFLWHFSHLIPTDLLMARDVLVAARHMGMRVFPDASTSWHFDDKIAQKYLLEAVGAPTPHTTVLYDREGAEAWVESAAYPFVFKLRRGSGSSNVRLIRNVREARVLVKKVFGTGHSAVPATFGDARTRLRSAASRGSIMAALSRLPVTVRNLRSLRKAIPMERGYLLAQEYLPGNEFDTRVTVIGDRAFAFTRSVRDNDFRASGSGRIDYSHARIDLECVRLAHVLAKKLQVQSCAFDFARDPEGRPRVLEVSYAYQAKAVYDCPGYWDGALKWRPGNVWPQDAILDDLLKPT